MTKRMLIDATHAEETRVVVLDNNRLTEYDVEASSKKQLKGNIYLAKIVRVEPSLQAAFVEYGGNRHGFLAFGEIHPDYYQIPVADRQRLIELQEQEARAEDDDDDYPPPRPHRQEAGEGGQPDLDIPSLADQVQETAEPGDGMDGEDRAAPPAEHIPANVAQALPIAREIQVAPREAQEEFPSSVEDIAPAIMELGADFAPEAAELVTPSATLDSDSTSEALAAEDSEAPEVIGGEHDTSDDAARERRSSARFLRHYKIQEVIRRRQIVLIQVVKEERGTKGAALTTYISLAGRYSVLMPNSPRGGGVSRKITSATDRRRLKEIMAELELPRGMGMIVRTAGANRPRPEIVRDCESLLRLWDDIREHTLKSVAPALIYEEASLIKRAIRDSYSGDVDEVLVDGEAGWRAARDFMRMMMPSHARKVQLWRGSDSNGANQPLFSHYQVEAQLDSMLQPTVQLRSGGYLVINQTEALVAIDVNSGRSTRERGIEETALRTNMEAAEEVARQLRLRDLAGLIVIDFIDMEARKHNAMVERRLKDALAVDRARIQLGHISHFGLLEMSRQRLRPSLAETTFVPCVHCGGTGHMRSAGSAALHVLRAIEDEGAKRRAAEILVHTASSIALYILNHKRELLSEIETRTSMRVGFAADETLLSPQYRIEKIRAQTAIDTAPVIMREAMIEADTMDEEDEMGRAEARGPATSRTDSVGHGGGRVNHRDDAEDGSEDGRRRRRRRRRGGSRRQESAAMPGSGDQPDGAFFSAEDGQHASQAGNGDRPPQEAAFPGDAAPDDATPQYAAPDQAVSEPHTAAEDPNEDSPRRRRSRGGRRRRGDNTPREGDSPDAQQGDMPAARPNPVKAPQPAYAGPTPADPFGGAFDIFDALEQALETTPTPPAPAPVAAPTPAPAPRAAVPIEQQQPQATATETDTGATTEPVSEPAVRPMLVGDAPTAQKKRGWWRRG